MASPIVSIRSAQALAIQRLTEILRTSDDPVQIRLTSELLLRLKPEDHPAALVPAPPPPPPQNAGSETAPTRPSPAITAAASDESAAAAGPLTALELIALRQLLPAVRPERFRKRAAHWRAVLARSGRSPPPVTAAA